MAFSKSTNTCKDQVQADILQKVYQEKERERARNWRHTWGWLLTEYEKYKDVSQKMSEKSEFLAQVKKGIVERVDHRSIKPIPESTNHEYGWLVSRKEFALQIYGEEYFHPRALPNHYKIMTDPYKQMS